MPSHKLRYSRPRTAQFRLKSAKVLDIQHVRRTPHCQLTTFKTIAACYKYRGRTGIAKPGWTNERKFYEAVRVSKETVPVGGGVGGLSRRLSCVCFQGNKNLLHSFIRQSFYGNLCIRRMNAVSTCGLYMEFFQMAITKTDFFLSFDKE